MTTLVLTLVPTVILGVLLALWRASLHRYRDCDAIFACVVLPASAVLGGCILVALVMP